jgi:hypothetical protein
MMCDCSGWFLAGCLAGGVLMLLLFSLWRFARGPAPMKLPLWLKRWLGKLLFDDRVTVEDVVRGADHEVVNGEVIPQDARFHTYIDPVSQIGFRLDIESPVEGEIDGRKVMLPLKRIMEIVGEKAILDPIFKQLREKNARVHVHHPGTEN